MSELLRQVAALVEIPSPSGGEVAYAEAVAEILARRGYGVERQPVEGERCNLIARPAGAAQLWFSTHLDVVPPHLPPRVEGTRLYGRGAADTKGPLVAMFEAAARLAERGIRTGFLLVVGEEVDHCGAIVAARELPPDGAPIVLGEPTSNRVAAAQKGMLKVRVVAEGVAGHSAFPDRGVSAIDRLLVFLEAVRREPWPDDPVLGPTTCNVGLISGGVAANVFAPEAHATLMLRLATSAEAAQARLEALCPEGVSLTRISGNDPVRLEAPAGFPTCVVPFNSDASYLSALGPIVLCGPGAIEVAHSDHEHIDLADIEAGIDTYVRLGEALLRD
ncbi:MAG: M20/M25/M40 family metallo-hydrolase [Planctomycetota bacterium]|nr:MAG: M20/M25/M40 family metallo-hydrolase [Planctomycetota bacterium]